MRSFPGMSRQASLSPAIPSESELHFGQLTGIILSMESLSLIYDFRGDNVFKVKPFYQKEFVISIFI